ncbi:MAG: ATP-binding protein [Flavobacteriales bacterium]|nr:ATP-binding protein [Flavobacteriales bacterium]
MINKRLLIKNLLAHHDECSFYDKKRQLNLHTKEGKAKFLKHICALSNSNPGNNSYIVVGVEDETNEVVGDDFFDDSRIQNLVNAYLENAPRILYENIPFPNLPKDKVVGLVTVRPNPKTSYFKKGIHTIPAHTVFKRVGSNSVPTEEKIPYNKTNIPIVVQMENQARNSIRLTLDGVVDFMMHSHKDMQPKYKVFKELFVVCWAGISKKIRGQEFLSRVDIFLVNEQIKLFYSALDVVTIDYDQNSFVITEYVPLGLHDQTSLYALEQKKILFFDNGYYKLETEFLFDAPQYNKKMLHHIYNAMLSIVQKLEKQQTLTVAEAKDILHLPSMLMICYWNGFEKAKQILIEAKPYLKKYQDPTVFVHFKETMRILRKMKYDVN